MPDIHADDTNYTLIMGIVITKHQFYAYDSARTLAFFAESRVFSFRSDIRVYPDQARRKEILVLKPTAPLGQKLAYEVFDPVSMETVGFLVRQKRGFISTEVWLVEDPMHTEIARISVSVDYVKTLLARFIGERFRLRLCRKSVGTAHGLPICSFSWQIKKPLPGFVADFASDTQNLLDKRLRIASALVMRAIDGAWI